ncbi:MAG: Fe-S cluster assembly protein SufD [Candidatus Marinimicrobia bacterium]|nr:Fe-S cluster assembly protein SufD [Candidatus Neomarinimicrobiota bacterium]MBL7010825.1 Fe-S cluster assembly protein SufD [Candidatus Neomarinimicrobiota bacterium]MBL7030992.1 Fe-S cluster assembly protein SufD [Candidatus Neomarinimicrobiota bacterium]
MSYLDQQFDALLKYWPDEDRAIRTLRTHAFDQFNSTGFPTKKWEEWQFTDFSKLSKKQFKLSRANDLPSIPKSIPGLIPDLGFILIINGHYQPQLSSLPNGVRVSTHLEDFNADENIYSWGKSQNPFQALNTAMMNSGVSIHFEPNKSIEKPLQIIYLMTELSEPLMNHPRFHYHIGDNSQVTILEHYIGLSSETYFVNSVSHATVGANASLHHIRIQEESETASHIASTHYQLESDARLIATHFSLGGELYRHDIHLKFNGHGGDASLNGLCLTENSQHHDQHVTVDHQRDGCNSHQLFKYILGDKSSGVFNGKVIVRENTKQTDADQSNKNLLLSPAALMNANPQLEIYSEDVKCAHGSTTGQIDPEALFYMRSRGLSQRKATELIIGGFAKEILEPIPNEHISDYINQKINHWLRLSQKNG